MNPVVKESSSFYSCVLTHIHIGANYIASLKLASIKKNIVLSVMYDCPSNCFIDDILQLTASGMIQ